MATETAILGGCKHYARQPYWTAVASADGGHAPALLEMRGGLEPTIAGGTLHPLVLVDGEAVRAEDFPQIEHDLVDGCLPMPSIRFGGHRSAITLTLDVLVHRPPGGASVLLARYALANHGDEARAVVLVLDYLGYKVQPPTQGQDDPKRAKAGRIAFVRLDASRRRVASETAAGRTRIELLTPPERVAKRSRTGAGGDDAAVAASYRLHLAPGARGEVVVAVPYGRRADWLRTRDPSDLWQACFEQTRAVWREKLAPIEVDIPQEPRLAQTLRYSAAVALMHRRDGLFVGGPRVYDETVWLRDGVYVARMLLQCGIAAPVVAFVDRYAQLIEESAGDVVPCGRGPALYPGIVQYDALGQWLHLVAETYRFTGDAAFLARHWPSAERARAAIRRLSASGVMAPCASHEGYGLAPDTYQRTVWVNAWTLRGLKDGVFLARATGDEAAGRAARLQLESFRETFYRAVQASMERHGITFVPGSLDQGDPDPNAVVLLGTLCDEWQHLPADLQAAYRRSLDMLFEHYRARRSVPPEASDAQFSPFEFRVVEGLVRAGEWRKAHELFDYLLSGQRPRNWLSFADQIWCDPERRAYVADRPHPWGHADFAGALRAMLLCECESAERLVVGRGVHPRWFRGGVSARDLPTRRGALSFALEPGGSHCLLEEGRGGFRMPANGITVAFPGTTRLAVPSLPARVRLSASAPQG